MTKFIKIQPHIEVSVPEYFDDEREVDVQVNFRVSEDGVIFWGPMDCHGSIHRNRTMMQLQNEFRENYEKKYEFVQVTEVFIDQEFLTEYKAYAKVANKAESEKLMGVVLQMLGMPENNNFK